MGDPERGGKEVSLPGGETLWANSLSAIPH